MRPCLPIMAIAALAASSAAAQERLVPFEDEPFMAAYHSDMRRVFAEAFEPGTELRAIVYPSFQTEYAVGLRRRGGGHEIFAIRPAKQVWAYQWLAIMKSGRGGSMTMNLEDPKSEPVDRTPAEIARLEAELPDDPADLPLARCAAPVDEALAATLSAAWRRMLEAVRPGEPLSAGTDGTTYRFSMETEGRALAGEIWTPRPKSPAGRLAALADTMRTWCETKKPEDLARIAKLARRLAKP